MKWVLEHLFSVKILLVVLIVLVASSFVRRTGFSQMSYSTAGVGIGSARNMSFSKMAAPTSMMVSVDQSEMMPTTDAAPTFVTPRLVVRNTTMSLVVSSVSTAMSTIEALASSLGGYLVDSSMSQPEGAASGTITIRVSSEKRQEALASIKASGLRVISENVSGADVTDECVDIEERLSSLRSTKAKITELLNRSGNVTDLMNVQRELMNIQSQIDSFVGQQKYLDGNTKLTRITVHLSTDEFSLPFSPDQPWRPEVVFKTAVRSLIGSFRSLVEFVIWIGVYAPFWVPILIVVWLGRKYMRKAR